MAVLKAFTFYTVFLYLFTNARALECVCNIVEVHGDLTAFCSDRNLTKVPQCLPTNIVSLDLTGNGIRQLRNHSFLRYGSLLKLTLNKNKINQIDSGVFGGLHKLQHLSISGNQLNISGIPSVFNPLVSLQSLDISRNMDATTIAFLPVEYPNLGFMSKLFSLSVDLAPFSSFNNSNISTLTELEVVHFDRCYLQHMNDSTFVIFPPQIQEVLFQSCPFIRHFDLNFLKPFVKLQVLKINKGNFHLKEAFSLLYPFVNKSMEKISMINVGVVDETPVIVTKDMVRYLQTICIKTLILAENNIVGFEKRSLTFYQHPECFENMIFSGNRFSFVSNTHFTDIISLIYQVTNLHYLDMSFNPLKYPDITYCDLELMEDGHDSIYNDGCYKAKEEQNKGQSGNIPTDKVTSPTSLTFPIPSNLTTIRLTHYLTAEVLKQQKIMLKNIHNLRYIDVSYMSLQYFPDISADTEFNVRYVDISGIDANIFLNKSSIPLFQTLETLIVQNVNLDRIGGNLADVFKLIPNVHKLDISFNNLWFINEDAFSKFKNLTELILANNILPGIPNGVMGLRNLTKLDMRYNRVQSINETIRNWIDKQGKRDTFELKIKGNSLKCTCDTKDFVKWLSKNTYGIIFDKSSNNYSCMLDNGTISDTATVNENFNQLFSDCDSKTWLKAGITTLVILMILIFTVAVVFNYRWKLMLWLYTKFKRVVQRGLDKKLRYDVYISYPENTFPWISTTLLPKLENSWNLNICIEDRDFMLGCPKSDEIVKCVSESRHAIFVTEEMSQHNQWTKFEIERVKYEKCTNYLQNIVVIVKDPTATRVPLDFDDILENVTLIIWSDDESGWDQLRIALFSNKI